MTADPGSEVLEPVLDAVDRFVGEHVDAAAIDRSGRIPPRVLEGLADLGAFAITIPEAYGGAGLGLGAACRLVERLAVRDRSVATTVGLHLGLGTRALVARGTPAQRARWLPSLASGRTIAAFAATEAGAGSDLHAISTVAREDGDGLRVDGAKIFVTNGGLAGLFTLLVSTPGLGGARRGHSLLVLEATDEGLGIGPEEDKLGLRGSSTTPLYLDGVRAPRDRVLGEPGQGMDAAHEVLAWGRAVMAAGCVGAAQAALTATAAHLSRRVQFGQPLGRFPVARRQLADMAATHFAMGAAVRHACEGPPEALAARSMAAKVLCSEGDWHVADTAVQLHGGVGFTEESGLPLLLRDARITRIFEGANDVLLVRLGGIEAVSPVPRTARRPRDAELAASAEVVEGALRARRRELERTHGIGLLRRQPELHQLGRLVLLREVADAVALRAEQDDTPLARSSALLWLAGARARAERHLRSPIGAAHVEAAADLLLEGARP